VSIINSIFKMNKVKYFGGVFYLNINKTYDMTIKDNIFFNNYAGVAGGVAFFEHINKNAENIIFLHQSNNNKNNTLLNNTAISHGSIFATHPSQIIKSNTELEKLDINSGGSIVFTISLIDTLGNNISDEERYYSNIGIDAKLYDESYNEVHNYYIPEINNIFFNGKI